MNKPISQCVCNQTMKRGGDDCSVTFCLNDCKPYGICDYKTGICKCNENFYGLDCSLYMIKFRGYSEIIMIDFMLILFCFLLIF